MKIYKMKALIDFNLKDYNKIEILTGEKVEGKVIVNSVFTTSEQMAKYLTGDNSKNLIVAEIIEEKVIEKPKGKKRK